jgi:hypothetical protein
MPNTSPTGASGHGTAKSALLRPSAIVVAQLCDMIRDGGTLAGGTIGARTNSVFVPVEQRLANALKKEVSPVDALQHLLLY